MSFASKMACVVQTCGSRAEKTRARRHIRREHERMTAFGNAGLDRE